MSRFGSKHHKVYPGLPYLRSKLRVCRRVRSSGSMQHKFETTLGYTTYIGKYLNL